MSEEEGPPNRRQRSGNAAVDRSKSGLVSTGVDVLTGPAQGKRILFTGNCATLGMKDDPVVTIRPSQRGYLATASNPYIGVTLNGNRLTDKPDLLADGDVIEFAELKARFFVEE